MVTWYLRYRVERKGTATLLVASRVAYGPPLDLHCRYCTCTLLGT